MTNMENNERKKNKTTYNMNSNKKTHIVVPYMKGLSESYKNISRRHGIEMHFKGGMA